MKKLTLSKPLVGQMLTREQMKNLMGGNGPVSIQCTYYFWDGTSETGNVTGPSGYTSAEMFAQDFCANDYACANVVCG